MQNFQRREFLAKCTGAAASTLIASTAAGVLADEARKNSVDVPAVDCDFPGGNIVFERIEGDDVYLHQDQRDTPRFWFYWYFRVRSADGRTLTFHFTKGDVIGALGPAASTDGGETWSWLGKKAVNKRAFTYTFPKSADEVRFCLGMPYQEANLRRFLSRYADNPHLRIETHSTTRKSRKTERLHLGKLDDRPNYRVLLTCRHHSCEMMASWVLEGIMETILSDTDDGRWFCENVEIAAVPFMDLDGVEDGDQGKNRAPHDHNRDYTGRSIYPSVAALRQFAPKWSEGRLKLALDMHCPWFKGGGDMQGSSEQIFLVDGPSQEVRQQIQKFSKTLQQVQTGPLVYSTKHNLPWGRMWNKGKHARCGIWAAELPGISVGTTIEIPYAKAGGKPVTVETARAFGHDLARAIRRYLEENCG